MSKLFAYLSYRDFEAAITWLEALGFETTTRHRDNGGTTVHAELRLGDAVVMVAPADEPYETPKLIRRSTGHGLYLLVDDVAALHGAALRAGGSTVFAPEKTEWEPSAPASSTRRVTSGFSGPTNRAGRSRRAAAVGDVTGERRNGPTPRRGVECR